VHPAKCIAGNWSGARKASMTLSQEALLSMRGEGGSGVRAGQSRPFGRLALLGEDEDRALWIPGAPAFHHVVA